MINAEISTSYNDDRVGESDMMKRRREFEDYASAKAREIDEQRSSWRYYHIDQWTTDQIKTLKKRHQPLITFDRTARKIDSLGGTIRRLRTDPKCYPNAPNGEQGAEVATQVIRTICDASFAEDIEVECCKDALIHGLAVDELLMRAGDHGDPDLAFGYVDPRTFFYDPRSLRTNFQDWRFHGIYKWADIDELDLLEQGASDRVRDNLGGDMDYMTAFDSDRDQLWVDTRDRVRLIDHWYKVGSMWKYCIHAGGVDILSADSPFYNQRGESISKFNAFAAMIDIDGDHYGFIRRLKGPQDAMNQHRSKAMHIMNTRQIKIKDGTVDDIEVTRREASRPDGTLVYRGNKDDLEILKADSEFLQQTNYYTDAKAEIDTFGPNQQLIQEFGQNVSGRAANMLQQAGLAELGPFLKNFRMWKLARYQAAWCAAQRYWTSERMLRVTGNEQVYQFMQINGVELNQYGLPQLVNMLGNIDVEIKVDEGPDTETIMGDIFDLLMALSQNNVPIPPAAIIEASYLPLSEKQKLQQMIGQVDPVQQAAQQLQLQKGQADVNKTNAEAGKLTAETGKAQSASMLNVAKARTEGQPDGPPTPPTPLDVAERIANINETNATAQHKRASASSLEHKALITPLQMMGEHAQRNADRDTNSMNGAIDRAVDSLHRVADRGLDHFHRSADREQKKQDGKDRLTALIQRNATPE
jgi:hypothetical protein